MVSTIQLLDNNLINQIAAGEVIERPVSVVKELVENSLDAEATEVVVETANGGKSLIKVSDNGQGMSPEDLEMCVQRHATSKIHSQEDLFRIGTLGFRGEAMPSIASVSKMTIISKKKDSQELGGHKMVIEDSEIKSLEKNAHNGGTMIEVTDLFYNVPARLKFLKTNTTELGHIQKYLSRLMLSRPDTSFTFINDGKVVLQTQGLTGSAEISLRNAIGTVFGKDVAKKLAKLDLDLNEISISGFISEPTKLSSSRNSQVFFVNNRNIFSPILNKAVDTAISDVVPRGKFPYVIMFIDIAYDQVDVNVHPAKREVRFADSGKVFDVVRSAVANCYSKLNHFQQKEFNQMVEGVPRVKTMANHFSSTAVSGRSDFAKDQPIVAAELISSESSSVSYNNQSFNPVDRNINYKATLDNNMLVLGQANKTYIIILDGDDLLLVDQHAAHERILYEETKELYINKQGVQDLLLPENIDLGSEKLSLLIEFADTFDAFGFVWEKFSETSVMLRAVPLLSTKYSMSKLFLDLIEDIDESGYSNCAEEVKEKLFATIACKAAVKSGDVLDLVEMKKLISDLVKLPNYQTCPHGRPTLSTISKHELDKRFKRI